MLMDLMDNVTCKRKVIKDKVEVESFVLRRKRALITKVRENVNVYVYIYIYIYIYIYVQMKKRKCGFHDFKLC